jgi:hypothetical protein
MMERFRQRERVDALERINNLFATVPSDFEESGLDAYQDEADEASEEVLVKADWSSETDVGDPELNDAITEAEFLITKSGRLDASANEQDAEELKSLVADLRQAIARRSLADIIRISAEVEDIVFYLEGA